MKKGRVDGGGGEAAAEGKVVIVVGGRGGRWAGKGVRGGEPRRHRHGWVGLGGAQRGADECAMGARDCVSKGKRKGVGTVGVVPGGGRG